MTSLRQQTLWLPSWGVRLTRVYCLAWEAEIRDVVVMIGISEDCEVSF